MSRERFLLAWPGALAETVQRAAVLPYPAAKALLLDLSETMADIYDVPQSESDYAVSQELRRIFPTEWALDPELARDEAKQIQVSEVESEEVQWVWWSRIPAGKPTLLDGDPGLGKSTLTLDITARITTGNLFPDGWSCGPGKVILLSAEDGVGDTIRPRLEAAEADVSMVSVISAIIRRGGRETPPDIENDIPTIERLIDADTKLVVIDPLMAYLSPDTNAYRDHEIRRALLAVSEMARRTGVAVLLVRHLRKGAHNEGALYAGGGSIGIAGAARSVLLVGADPDNPRRRVLAAVKTNLCRTPPSLAFSIEEDDKGRPYIGWADGITSATADELIQGRKPKLKPYNQN